MHLLPFVCSACLNSYASMHLSFNHNLEVMKNTTYLKNVLSLIQLHIFSLSQKGYFSLYYKKKSRFAWKRGVSLGLKISDFGWKRVFFRPKSAKKGCFSDLGRSMVYALGVFHWASKPAIWWWWWWWWWWCDLIRREWCDTNFGGQLIYVEGDAMLLSFPHRLILCRTTSGNKTDDHQIMTCQPL